MLLSGWWPWQWWGCGAQQVFRPHCLVVGTAKPRLASGTPWGRFSDSLLQLLLQWVGSALEVCGFRECWECEWQGLRCSSEAVGLWSQYSSCSPRITQCLWFFPPLIGCEVNKLPTWWLPLLKLSSEESWTFFSEISPDWTYSGIPVRGKSKDFNGVHLWCGARQESHSWLHFGHFRKKASRSDDLVVLTSGSFCVSLLQGQSQTGYTGMSVLQNKSVHICNEDRDDFSCHVMWLEALSKASDLDHVQEYTKRKQTRSGISKTLLGGSTNAHIRMGTALRMRNIMSWKKHARTNKACLSVSATSVTGNTPTKLSFPLLLCKIQ